MSIINTILIMISIATALSAVLFAYGLAVDSKFHPIATVAMCIIVAVLAGSLWLPSTLAMFVIFATECKTECE